MYVQPDKCRTRDALCGALDLEDGTPEPLLLQWVDHRRHHVVYLMMTRLISKVQSGDASAFARQPTAYDGLDSAAVETARAKFKLYDKVHTYIRTYIHTYFLPGQLQHN